ncbi:SIR2 family protein, partial [Cronobacter malonaticus]|uniref:SIR2 family protein n=3 Tax=Cronobacter malonaticus TaxID=413503 RepID=UPI0009079983|nr:SIR2 family protein [Cronobacter malonaticus]EGT4384304.1 SIR2 family protein [Cronobacter malonaticus]EGT4421998.1 SIR2 family protein [Cronobacter malonaticus]EGT4447089.1 SIR2 family protein [Cronobacter malonaticus]EGT4456344.1 SIR2 family protein [Cronobacter malonaticus]ELY2512201.1 SIR2 family protein [Cronobacter malonaticus]
MISWPDPLIKALARRRCVIMIGAGISKNSFNEHGKSPATWEEFLKECLNGIKDKDCITQLINQKDYLSACEIIKDKLTLDVFVDKVQAEYQRAGYRPAKIHEHIYNLDASIVASPNFDTIYDSYAGGVSAGTLIVKDHTSDDIANYLLGGDTRLFIKTHGSANDPRKIIFTRRDYAEARTKHVLFYEILKALALTHTFLFLGCGTDDPDIRILFEDIQFAYERMPYHYMTLPAGEVHNDILGITSKSMRVQFLTYSPDHGHIELTQSLGQLAEKVEQFRVENLKETLKW